MIEVAQEYLVTIHILPCGAGTWPVSNNFVIFPHALDSDVAYVEGSTARRTQEERKLIRYYTCIFDSSSGPGSAGSQSQDLICAATKELCAMIRMPNPHPSLDDAQYNAVINSGNLKSTFGSANGVVYPSP